MARPREFTIDDALEKAMRVFWAHGYEATSMHDLTAAMALSKSSLYDTFGSKHELFLSTLEHYNETVASRRPAGIIANAESPRAGIVAVFDYFIDNILSGADIRGCFANNSAAEVAGRDPEARQRIEAGFGHLEQALYDAVKAGQKSGEIPTDHDAPSLAHYLCVSIQGLMVVGKTNPPREKLEDVARIVLSVFD